MADDILKLGPSTTSASYRGIDKYMAAAITDKEATRERQQQLLDHKAIDFAVTCRIFAFNFAVAGGSFVQVCMIGVLQVQLTARLRADMTSPPLAAQSGQPKIKVSTNTRNRRDTRTLEPEYKCKGDLLNAFYKL